ncbi:hypothetical protein [Sphingopyxis sp. GW247-27LB]|uniref:hypothetical protein n=1 Tax=Sphingopyxis sp. GW247-27LB TaxID=2012632 RepID=UPI000BA67349|nr:hypothetical protein [Sphingopyxis sp. GW247-27LB]PAL20215.1 hypothetical protein CD928_17560 [Sphingopyxis sp. GW247-27LB]
MPLLDRVKERCGSELSDAELQAMIDAIVAELDARLGPVGPVTIELGDPDDPHSRFNRTLRVLPPIDATAELTIVELDPGNSGGAAAELELAPGDYRLLHGGRTLQRLTGGPNGRGYWAPLVRLTYTPQGASQAQRDEAVIKLMMVDLSYRGGLKSERAGDYSITLSGDPVADRESIIAGLIPASGFLLA